MAALRARSAGVIKLASARAPKSNASSQRTRSSNERSGLISGGGVRGRAGAGAMYTGAGVCEGGGDGGGGCDCTSAGADGSGGPVEPLTGVWGMIAGGEEDSSSSISSDQEESSAVAGGDEGGVPEEGNIRLRRTSPRKTLPMGFAVM
jgi:hypothetical protein